MNRSVIHNNNRVWTWIRVTKREELVLNKSVKCISINGTRVNLACNITINSHCRKYTEVGTVLEAHRIWNNATFRSPSMRAFSRTGIDARFVKKNNLFRAPLCNLSDPGISKLFISLCSFFCELLLDHNVLKCAFLYVIPRSFRISLNRPLLTVISYRL